VQVNLLSLNDTAVLDKRTGGVLLALQGGSFVPLLKHEAQVLSERARPGDEQDSQVAAAAAPCSADVIQEAERNVEGSSRAFRRQVAHESGVEQFRQGREGTRQAMQAKEAAPASRASSGSSTESQTESTLKAGARSTATTEARAASAASAKANSPASATNSTGNRVNSNPASTQAPSAAKAATGSPSSAAPTGNGITARGGPAALAPVRAAAAVQVQAAARPGAAGGAKGSGQAPVASVSARSSVRTSTFSATKAGASGAAENADRSGNVERIVRLVAQRIRGERSHTVMRLDPPELGSLRLQMDLKGNALTLRIDTSTHVAHRLLSEDVHRLRHGLEASGIQLERVDLRAPTQTAEATEQGSPQQGGTEGEWQEGSGESDAEHPEEHGRDSHPAGSDDGVTRGPDPEPATELLVNMVA
jgi:flagellar hook-length control protein FliK